MTARAHVEHEWDGVAVWLSRKFGDRRHVVQPVELLTAEQSEATRGAPSFRLTDDMARELLDALSAYFGGTSDTRQLRKDYEAERGRVDRFIGHLTKDAASPRKEH